MPTAELKYVAASCNRYSNVSDCRDSDGLLAFGSARFVALWYSSNIDSTGVHATLPGHLGDVTSLRFIKIGGKSEYILSGDSTGTARVWREVDSRWESFTILTGHAHSISALTSLELPTSSGHVTEFLVVTGSSDGSIRSWKLSTDSAIPPVLLQSMEINKKLPLELALSYLPDSQSVVLAIGSTENRIQIYTSPTTQAIQFAKSLALEGHSDWVRSLTFITPRLAPTQVVDYDVAVGEVLLASGSQDNYIRLWRFSRLSHALPDGQVEVKSGFEALDELERTLAEAGEEEQGELRVKAHDFTVEADGIFSCSSEAVLLGHDSWVTGLHWAPNDSTTSQLRLLSSSADRSMIMWTPAKDYTDTADMIWTSSKRFGEFASATNLGFFGALWGQDSRTVLAHGWGGSWHVWREEGEVWEPIVATTGHFEGVKSLAWEPEGEFLLSAGADMTTRLHAPWSRAKENGEKVETWHELGRPQIHGYPIASIAFTSRLQFVSGADEKIVRVFDAPKVCLSSLKNLAGIGGLGDEESRPMAANVPPLGLSNRAVADDADLVVAGSNDPFEAVAATNYVVAAHPPFEEQLLGSTLWPEIEKIYGHGYEIIALAAAHTTPIIVTACKATSAEHAVIRLYETKTWKPIGTILEGHSLTITSIKFSPDDRWLLSVSRDRTWHLYEKIGDTYQASANAKLHARIIWDCCWASNSAGFFTASRDKTVKVWTQGEQSWNAAATLKFDEAATSLAICSIPNPSRHLLAVGLENGQIHLFSLPIDNLSTFSPFLILDPSIAHALTVTSLAFCPKVESRKMRLASGSDDRSVRIVDISTD